MRLLGVHLVAGFVLMAPPARAQTQLDERHGDGFYVGRGVAIAVATGLTIATSIVLHPKRPESCGGEWLAMDEAVRGTDSATAARTSDILVTMAMVVPLAAEFGSGMDSRLANMTVFYGEVLSANLLLNTIVKYSVPRLRPYTYRSDARSSALIDSEGADAYRSFYSGHTSMAFAAATAGSYLFAAGHPGAEMNKWLWGFEFGTAAATALLRVRAGRHYYSDIIVGAVVGTALGLGVPLLEGVVYRPSATELGFAGGGAGIGAVASLLVPLSARVVPPIAGAGATLTAMPTMTGKTAGISLVGAF